MFGKHLGTVLAGAAIFTAASAVASPATALTVRERAAAIGLAFSTNSQGRNAVLDADSDGFEDDLLLNRHNTGTSPLYRGGPRGFFTSMTQFAKDDRHGCVVADFDGDTRDDFFCTLGSCSGRTDPTACNGRVFHRELWLQRSPGAFTDVGPTSGASTPRDRGRDVVVLDANGDGLPDLATAAEGSPPVAGLRPSENRLFLNLGGARFQEVIDTPVRRQIGSECVAAFERDDGGTNLAFCADPGTTTQPGIYTFRGDAAGSFTDVTAARAYRQLRARDLEFADVVGDAAPDLIVTSAKRVAVWENVGDDFPRETYGFAITNGSDTAACDVDRDGDRDLYVVNGRGGTINAPDVLLLNQGGGAFQRFAPAALPTTTVGAGDSALCVQGYVGGPMVVVQNGRNPYVGPTQAFVFTP